MMAIRNATEMDARGVSGCLTKSFEPYRRLYADGAYADTVLTDSGVRDRLKNMTKPDALA